MQHSDRTIDRARGHWDRILPALGVEQNLLNKRNQPCPVCSGKDRFRFTDKGGDGCFVCSQCGGGNGFTLLRNLFGWETAEAFQKVDEVLGEKKWNGRDWRSDSREAKNRENRERLWKGGRIVTDSSPAGRYLGSRIGIKSIPESLRWIGRAFYREGAGEPTYHPCMLALVRAADNESPSTIHRTFLTEDGHKANVSKPRLLMPGDFPPGGAVRLGRYTDVLGVAEGIETALSASMIFGVPVWSAISETMLANWIPPSGIQRVIIFGDNDASFVGQSAAFTLARRLSLVMKVPEVDVQIPPEIGEDWDDVWRKLSGIVN